MCCICDCNKYAHNICLDTLESMHCKKCNCITFKRKYIDEFLSDHKSNIIWNFIHLIIHISVVSLLNLIFNDVMVSIFVWYIFLINILFMYINRYYRDRITSNVPISELWFIKLYIYAAIMYIMMGLSIGNFTGILFFSAFIKSYIDDLYYSILWLRDIYGLEGNRYFYLKKYVYIFKKISI